MVKVKICVNCKAEFKDKYRTRKYCTNECRQIAVQKVCLKNMKLKSSQPFIHNSLVDAYINTIEKEKAKPPYLRQDIDKITDRFRKLSLAL